MSRPNSPGRAINRNADADMASVTVIEPAAAVVVTYHPDSDFPTRLAVVAAEVPLVVVVDNGSGPAAVAMLRKAAAGLPAVRLVENRENIGLAAALNAGCRAAAAAGCRWALTLDQDTAVWPGILPTLFGVLATHPNPRRVAVVGSTPRDRAGDPVYFYRGYGAYIPVGYALTSGSLTSLAAFAAVGGFRDDLFIDSIDHEYCYRVRAAGYHVVRAVRPVMTHVCGDPLKIRLGSSGRALAYSQYSPVRRYYITRNWLAVMAVYGLRFPGQLAVEGVAIAVSTGLAVLVEADKWKKVKAIALGALDAARGRMGRIGPRAARWLS